MRACIFTILLMSVLAHTASAGAPDADGDPNNAATWYRQAIEKYDSAKTEDAEWGHVWAFEADPDRGPSPEARRTIDRYRRAIRLVGSAARRTHCRFQPPTDRFAQQVNPHLQQMRTLLKILHPDFMLRVYEGDIDGAVDRLCWMYRMGDHPAQGQTLTGALVGGAMLAFADGHVAHALDRALIGPGEAARLLRELERFKGDDPLNYRNAALVDGRAQLQAEIDRYSGEGGLQKFRDDENTYYRVYRPAEAAALAQATQDDLERALVTAKTLYERFAAEMMEPDRDKARADLDALNKEIKDGRHGPFASSLMSGWVASAFSQMQRTRKQLDDRMAMLREIAEGKTDPMSLANAAVWWIRATAALERIDPDARRVIDEFALRPDVDPFPRKALDAAFKRDDVREALNLLETASQYARCDFGYAAPWSVTFRPYHAGLLACGRMLAVDAVRMLQADQPEDAARRLAIGYRLSSDLATDQTIAGAMAAHRTFSDIDSAAAGAIDRGSFLAAQLSLIDEQVQKFSRADPFHYHGAISAQRKHLGGHFIYLVQGMPESLPFSREQKHVDEAEAIVSDLDADRLLAMLAVWDNLYLQEIRWGEPVALSSAGLEPIFDLAALHDAYDLAPALREWSKRGVLGQIGAVPLPTIAPVGERASQSIDDYRACVQRLDRAKERR